MPQGALRRYLQFPQPPVGDDETTNPLPPKGGAPVRPMPAGAPMQAQGVQTVNITAPRSGGFDDEIQTQLDAYKAQMAARPVRDIGAAPSRVPLPERPQASAWEALPQLFAGAGNVLSAGSNHPQDYLTPLMNRQQGMRDQAYGDRVAQAQNMFQNEREAYSDKLMRYSMELRDHEQRLSDLKGHIGMLTEQKYLQGQKTPQDMQDTQKRDAYRAMFDKFDMLKEAEDHAAELKATRPEDAKLIDEVLQNKKAAVQGRGQGIVELMTNTQPGRGLMESPQGPIHSTAPLDPAFLKAVNRPNSEVMQGQAERLKNPAATLAEFRKATGNPKATIEEYVQRLKAGQAWRATQKDSDTLEKKEPKKGIAQKLQEELQGGGSKQYEEWARKQAEAKD